MKQWSQDTLPLKIIQDLGLEYATPESKSKTRFIIFECPTCNKPFRAQPSKVLKGTTTMCGPCGYAKHTPKITNDSKECTTCKETKPLSDYYKSTRKKDGYDSRCKTCADSYKAKWSEGNSEHISLQRDEYRLQKRYGITLDDYTDMLIKQDYSCAICGNSPEEGRNNTYKLSVDHCHTTGEVRGLLCQKCNTGLGLLGDSYESILKALNYLGTK